MGTLFVVNPAAGQGRGRARWEKIKAIAERLWPNHEVCDTEGPGHGRELARYAVASGAELIVAVGGDGTLGEVVDGYLSAPAAARQKAAVATFPAGSGCDFARHMGVPREPEAWAAALSAARPRLLDAARARFRGADGAERGRHFLNVAAWGLAGDVAVGVERRGKLLGGTLTYLLESVLAIWGGKPRAMRLTVDGVEEPEAEYHMVALANTSTIGGGMRVAPAADPQDGLLDLLTVGPLSRRRLFALMPRVYVGGHVGQPGVVLRRVKSVAVSCAEPLALNVDGDLDGVTPASFEILPKSVPFLS